MSTPQAGAEQERAGDPPLAGAAVVVCENGPILVRGDYTLSTLTGDPIDPQRRTIALCRCGRSQLKPFCDGSHTWARGTDSA
ncbi:MAG: CDGSH iron-sulfur domain-containing protein [Kineosporiaceae bacterium]